MIVTFEQNLTIMKEKILLFQHFLFQLSPVDHDQLEMFEKESRELRKQKKNEYFTDALDQLEDFDDGKHVCKLFYKNEENYIFKIGQRKTTTISDEKLKEHFTEDHPWIFVLISNHPEVQTILISENPIAFSKPVVVKNFLNKVLGEYLDHKGLELSIEPKFKKKEFWSIVGNNPISKIDFTIVKPNMARISKNLSKALKEAIETVDSHTSHISFKAADKGSLNNIKPTNKDINEMVNYASEGGGNISVKMKGVRHVVKTSEMTTTSEISQAEIEGTPNAIIQFMKSWFKQ